MEAIWAIGTIGGHMGAIGRPYEGHRGSIEVQRGKRE